MGNKLREIFSDDFSEERREFVKKCVEDSLERRKRIRLVKELRTATEEAPVYYAKPFGGFIGDCECCDHFIRLPAFVEGGYCGKHKRDCGHSFTCKDNTSEYNKDWDEFQRIKQEETT